MPNIRVVGDHNAITNDVTMISLEDTPHGAWKFHGRRRPSATNKRHHHQKIPSLLASTLALGCLFLSAANAGTSTPAAGGLRDKTNTSRRRKPSVGTARNFYVTAELVEWDYAPTGKDMIDGGLLLDNSDAVVFAENTPSLIGRKYMKSLFKEYTDDTYQTEKEAPVWAGNIGPIIRAEVGDTILVHFKNMLPLLPASMHPHGVLYTPENEGATWRLNTSPGSAVTPGESYTYEWTAREDSGPTKDDGSNLWFYHGHVEPVEDIYSGLLGPLIIYEQGLLDAHGLPTDVDEEFVIMFMVSDENQSHYIEENTNKYGGDPSDEDFEESNLMHSMNGFVYGNLPGLNMTEGDTVRWHLAAYGTEVDLHTAHWHGNNVKFEGKNVDTLELLPSTFLTAIMTPDAVGSWLLHCHVNDHILAGMQAFYTVLPWSDDGSTSSSSSSSSSPSTD